MNFKRWFVLFFCLLVIFYCGKDGKEYRKDNEKYITWTYFNAKQDGQGHFIMLLKGRQRLNGKLIQVSTDVFVFNSAKEAKRAVDSYNRRDPVYKFYERADIDSESLRRLVEANMDKINLSLAFLNSDVDYVCVYIQFLYKDDKKIGMASKDSLGLEYKLKKRIEILIRSKELLDRQEKDIKPKEDKKEEFFYSSF